MRYHPDDFLRLMEFVEEQGGSQAGGRCTPRKYKIQLPDSRGDYRYKEHYTSGCGEEALFLVPYKKPEVQGEQGRKIEGAIGSATVCAVDDSMGLWPRFQAAITEDSH